MKKKILSLFLCFVVATMSFSMVFAVRVADGEGGTFKENAVDYSDTTSKDGNIYNQIDPSFGGDLGSMADPVAQVLGVIQVVGFIVAIAMVIYVGIKYLTAGAGSKAEVKSTMVPMLIGAALVGLAPTLVNWIFGIFTASNG